MEPLMPLWWRKERLNVIKRLPNFCDRNQSIYTSINWRDYQILTVSGSQTRLALQIRRAITFTKYDHYHLWFINTSLTPDDRSTTFTKRRPGLAYANPPLRALHIRPNAHSPGHFGYIPFVRRAVKAVQVGGAIPDIFPLIWSRSSIKRLQT